MSDFIEVPVRNGEKEETWKFRPMTVEDAALWASKIGSRKVLYESIKKRKEMLGVVHGKTHLEDNLDNLDMEKIDEYNKLSDAQAMALRDVTHITKQCLDYIVYPTKEDAEKLMTGQLEMVFEAIGEYTNKMFPLEDDQKKS